MLSFEHLPTPVVVALFLVACLGHLTLMITSHNWWYGQPFHKRVGDRLHLLHGFLTVAVDATKARATFTLIPHGEVSTDYSKKSAAELQAKVTTAAFDVAGGQLTPVS